MGKEILLVVDSIANEKNLNTDLIFQAVEKALAVITARGYDEPTSMRVAINQQTGDYETFRQWEVVDDSQEPIEEPSKQINLKQAKEINNELDIGDIIEESVESIGFGRIAAQQAKQIIMHEIYQAERAEIARSYQDKVDTLVNGIIKKVARDQILVDMGNNVGAVIPKNHLIPREAVRIGDRISAILFGVNEERKGPMLLLSRTSPKLVSELLKLEVPEISEDVIEVKAVARDPGSRAKVAVKTNDGRIDPIGACIGIRGSRVQNVTNSLNGERIDIILWSDEPAQMAVNALAPAEIASIVINEERKGMDIAVSEDQLAIAIGKNGQNVRLASELLGWKLNIMTEEEIKAKSETEISQVVEKLTKALDVDEDVAKILAQEGFKTLEDVAYTAIDELTKIEGFDEEIVEELRNRARNALLTKALSTKEAIGSQEPDQDLLDLKGMSRHIAYILASRGIVSQEDLAEQSVDELADIEELSTKKAAELIMEARKPWFETD